VGPHLLPRPREPVLRADEDHDVRTGPAETVLLGFVNANAGPAAITARQVARLRLPGNQARGPATTVSARMDELGPLIARLAESATLRARIVHSPAAAAAGWLDLTLEDSPDLSAWARYGTPSSGGPGLLAPDWQYTLGVPTVTRAEVAAGGEGVSRMFEEQAFVTDEQVWGGASNGSWISGRPRTPTRSVRPGMTRWSRGWVRRRCR
jgi:hypothetical protein